MEDLKAIVVTKAYTLNLEIVGKIRDLADRLGKNQSEIVRMAIDELFESLNEADELEATK